MAYSDYLFPAPTYVEVIWLVEISQEDKDDDDDEQEQNEVSKIFLEVLVITAAHTAN